MPLALLLAAACAASEAPATSPVQALPNERAVPAPAGVAEPPAVGRVIAIGDLHGDREAALAVFRMAGVIDAEGHWAAGAATLVQTGDTTDRGPDSKGVIDLLRQLQPEAAAAGGRVVALLGNHETMNLLGDWRYVSPEDLAGFGGSEARKAALGPDGDYGRWLRERGIVAKVGDAVFVHGGVTPSFASAGVDGINARAKRALAAGDRTDPVFGSDGPLWYRGYVQEPPSDACPRLEQALGALGAARMVVGHTTRRDGRIEVRCGGRLTVIDTGISAHYGRHLAAWVSTDGDAAAIYPTGPLDLEDPS